MFPSGHVLQTLGSHSDSLKTELFCVSAMSVRVMSEQDAPLGGPTPVMVGYGKGTSITRGDHPGERGWGGQVSNAANAQCKT